MSSTESRASSVTPPVLGADQNVWVLAATTSSAYVEVPAAWDDAYLTLQARGGEVFVAFSESDSETLDETGETTIVSNAFTAFDGGECQSILDGTDLHLDLFRIRQASSEDLYFYWKADATCQLRIVRSSGPVSV